MPSPQRGTDSQHSCRVDSANHHHHRPHSLITFVKIEPVHPVSTASEAAPLTAIMVIVRVPTSGSPLAAPHHRRTRAGTDRRAVAGDEVRRRSLATTFNYLHSAQLAAGITAIAGGVAVITAHFGRLPFHTRADTLPAPIPGAWLPSSQDSPRWAGSRRFHRFLPHSLCRTRPRSAARRHHSALRLHDPVLTCLEEAALITTVSASIPIITLLQRSDHAIAARVSPTKALQPSPSSRFPSSHSHR